VDSKERLIKLKNEIIEERDQYEKDAIELLKMLARLNPVRAHLRKARHTEIMKRYKELLEKIDQEINNEPDKE